MRIAIMRIQLARFVLALGIVTSLAPGVWAEPVVVPSVQEWTAGEGNFQLTEASRIFCTAADFKKLASDLKQFQADLAVVSGLKLSIVHERAADGDIVVALESQNTTIGEEGYELSVENKVRVSAKAAHGAFYGLQTLLQLFSQDKQIEKGVIVDYPKVDKRGLMIDCGRRYFEVEYLERVIRRMAWLKLNFFHWHLTDWNGFRIQSGIYPGLASEKAYSKQDIRRIQDYAAKFHIMVIPEIDLPAHGTWLTDYNPDLAFKCQSMRQARWQGEEANSQGKAFTLDISRPEVRKWIHDLLEEMIPLFDGPYFHIGGDEWQYDVDKYACPDLMKVMKEKGYKYPGDVFVEWINEVNKQVKSHGKTTHIWNWWRFSPNEKMRNQTSIQPDKDIVVHIWNRPRRAPILADGYSAIITTEEGPDALYVTPFDGAGKVGEYGVFNSESIYSKWVPDTEPNIMGFKLCLWCDRSEHQADGWFNKFYEFPLAVLSQRTWGSERKPAFDTFQREVDSLNRIP